MNNYHSESEEKMMKDLDIFEKVARTLSEGKLTSKKRGYGIADPVERNKAEMEFTRESLGLNKKRK